MTDLRVDGNAVAGLLRDIFGVEMTGRRGCCDNCGMVAEIGAVLVYRECPGSVLRCPSCGSMVMVIVETPGGIRVGVGTLRWIEM